MPKFKIRGFEQKIKTMELLHEELIEMFNLVYLKPDDENNYCHITNAYYINIRLKKLYTIMIRNFLKRYSINAFRGIYNDDKN